MGHQVLAEAVARLDYATDGKVTAGSSLRLCAGQCRLRVAERGWWRGVVGLLAARVRDALLTGFLCDGRHANSGEDNKDIPVLYV